ncbi:hypothetical protein HYV86_02555 [Candidatus Woesearchaeota archaeon]|nr:hypothetical protein [Candidatus Woesearchaeota archaeon]
MGRRHRGSGETLDNMLADALVASVAWRTFADLIDNSVSTDFADQRFCWFITSCTIITDAALGTGYCREKPLDREPSNQARELYFLARQGEETGLPEGMAENFPRAFGARIKVGLERLANTIVGRYGSDYGWTHRLFGIDPRQDTNLREKFSEVLPLSYIQSPLHDLDQAMPYLEELHHSPKAGLQSLKDIFIELGVPSEKLDAVFETAQQLSLIDPRHAITETYSGLVVPFTLADNQPFAGKTAYLKISRPVEIANEFAYLSIAAAHPLLRVITPRVLSCLYADQSAVAALVTLGTENDDIVSMQDQYTYFTLRQDVFSSAAVRSRFSQLKEDNPIYMDIFNRAVAHTLLTQDNHSHSPLPYLKPLFSLVHPWEFIEQRLAGCQDTSMREQFRSFKTAYCAIVPRVHQYAHENPTTIIHGDARPENVWGSPLGVRPLGDASHARAGNPEFDLGKLEVANIPAAAKVYLALRREVELVVNGREYTAHTGDADFATRSLEISFVNAVRYGMWKAGQNAVATHYMGLATKYLVQLKI